MKILGTRPKGIYLGTGDTALTGQHSLEKMGKERLHSVKRKYREMQFRDMGLDVPEQADGPESMNQGEVGLEVLTPFSKIVRRNKNMGKDTKKFWDKKKKKPKSSLKEGYGAIYEGWGSGTIVQGLKRRRDLEETDSLRKLWWVSKNF